MLIAILIFEVILTIELAVLIGFTWPQKKEVTGGWIPPKEAEKLDKDDSVIPMDERYEQDYMDNNTEPEL